MTPPERVTTVLCDLDGVVWLAHQPIAGSVEAVASLRSAGIRVVFVTNNSAATIDGHAAALAAIGVPAHDDVVSSATAAGRLVRPGERVLVTGGPGVVEAVVGRGADAVENDGSDALRNEPFDAVVVGLDRGFDYARLAAAHRAIGAGARFIATNTDATYPTPSGPEPGGGSIVAAIGTATGSEPTIAGKPHQPMADAILSHLARSGSADPSTIVMVGDRVETDGLMARRLACTFALVRTGVTSGPDQASAVHGGFADIGVEDLRALGDLLTAAR